MPRVLIADDSPHVLRSIRKVIEERSEWEVCGEAVDGLEAVSKAAELAPDLVVLDLSMPNLHGFQAARAIHTASPNTPLLLYTQHLFDSYLEAEARSAGFSGAVTKGSSDSLVAAIEALFCGETHFPTPSPGPKVTSAPQQQPEPTTPDISADEAV